MVARKRDKAVYDIVNEGFVRRARDVLERTHLDDILGAVQEPILGVESLLQAVVPDYIPIVTPLVNRGLKEAYQKGERIRMNAVYDQVLDEVFKKLKHVLALLLNPNIEEYSRYAETDKMQEVSKQVLEVLSRALTPTQAEIIIGRFGIGTGVPKTYEEIAQENNRRVKSIKTHEHKALKRLARSPNPERLRRTIPYL